MKRRLIIMLIAMAVMAVSITPVTVSAASVKKMTTYGAVMKSGGYVYCISPSGVYMVNERRGTVKTLTRGQYSQRMRSNWYGNMYKKGQYLYLIMYIGDGTGCGGLYRINVQNCSCLPLQYGDAQTMYPIDGETNVEKYAISGNNIYYKYGYSYRVMKLNGKGKKTTSTKCSMYTRYSNVSGYSVINQDRGDYEFSWLKTASGKRIFLGKSRPF